ncbi:hypothetical protein EIP86_008150 [Pleurotus ostreatoroseus]|nr:hypothetical protein EIP86_008150 [Pleurotus ostreatoroseus]
MLNLRLVARNPVRFPRFSARCLSTDIPSLLEQWEREQKPVIRTETLHGEHLASLFATLPTRDPLHPAPHPDHWQHQVRQDYNPLPYGHHLVFFHPCSAEHALRADRTDPEFGPPAPFTRRVWAGGAMSWGHARRDELRVGEAAIATASMERWRVSKTAARPMVIVDQAIDYRTSKAEGSKVAIRERRTHVYLTGERESRVVKPVEGLPDPDFVFEYLPTPTMLFRFSALTFNAHLIHLDKQYANEVEGYPGKSSYNISVPPSS